WENTSARYRRMMVYLKDVKSLVGRPPFGYRVSGDAKAKTLVLHPEESEALRTVVLMYLKGRSLRYLCAYLDDAVMPPPNTERWAPKSLAQLLRNPVLSGRRTDESGRTVLRVPPLLATDTWRKLRAEMARKEARSGVGPARAAV